MAATVEGDHGSSSTQFITLMSSMVVLFEFRSEEKFVLTVSGHIVATSKYSLDLFPQLDWVIALAACTNQEGAMSKAYIRFKLDEFNFYSSEQKDGRCLPAGGADRIGVFLGSHRPTVILKITSVFGGEEANKSTLACCLVLCCELGWFAS
ncbi:hypothetical protein H5410_020568 [Solanum commersonii]|uniref:Uncharacterized protein n=1 Tax=Solanum commersonii TaxID=4109 RepID=A0A9J5ZBI4_SOLCO|nr:hypothetical protein H5410_020568 [Solanum commersonii]